MTDIFEASTPSTDPVPVDFDFSLSCFCESLSATTGECYDGAGLHIATCFNTLNETSALCRQVPFQAANDTGVIGCLINTTDPASSPLIAPGVFLIVGGVVGCCCLWSLCMNILVLGLSSLKMIVFDCIPLNCSMTQIVAKYVERMRHLSKDHLKIYIICLRGSDQAYQNLIAPILEYFGNFVLISTVIGNLGIQALLLGCFINGYYTTLCVIIGIYILTLILSCVGTWVAVANMFVVEKLEQIYEDQVGAVEDNEQIAEGNEEDRAVVVRGNAKNKANAEEGDEENPTGAVKGDEEDQPVEVTATNSYHDITGSIGKVMLLFLVQVILLGMYIAAIILEGKLIFADYQQYVYYFLGALMQVAYTFSRDDPNKYHAVQLDYWKKVFHEAKDRNVCCKEKSSDTDQSVSPNEYSKVPNYLLAALMKVAYAFLGNVPNVREQLDKLEKDLREQLDDWEKVFHEAKDRNLCCKEKSSDTDQSVPPNEYSKVPAVSLWVRAFMSTAINGTGKALLFILLPLHLSHSGEKESLSKDMFFFLGSVVSAYYIINLADIKEKRIELLRKEYL